MADKPKALPTHVFMPNDIPMCPRCGTRTVITLATENEIPQHHKCLRKTQCGYEFLVEFKPVHKVRICWGSSLMVDERLVETYEFESQELLDAFMEGVDACEGWLNYEVMENKSEIQNNKTQTSNA